MTDVSLIEKFLDGDVQAFNTLVWRWEKPVYNYVLRYLGDTEEAKDVTQKVFIKVYKKLSSLKELEKFSSWIYRIALNLSRDSLRGKKRASTVSLERMMQNDQGDQYVSKEFIADDCERPDYHRSQSEMREFLMSALQEIPDEQRVVIIMKEYQGLKFHEIAKILDAPINTVKSRMYYGLTALRKVLTRQQIDLEALGYEL